MRRLIVALAACTLTAGASASDSLVVHGLSAHQGQRDDGLEYEEVNLGLGWRRSYGNGWAMQAGAYRNSYHKPSVYWLADWEPIKAGAWSAGLFAGVATGYAHGVTAGGLVVRWQGDRLGVALRGMPKVSEKQSGAVGSMELTYSIRG